MIGNPIRTAFICRKNYHNAEVEHRKKMYRSVLVWMMSDAEGTVSSSLSVGVSVNDFILELCL